MKAYKGYVGSIEFSEEDMVFHGRILGINDIVTFEAETPKGLVEAFHDSVDDYLDWCAELGHAPEKPHSGRILVRVPPELHGRASAIASRRSVSLNQWIAEAIEDAAARDLEDGNTVIRAAD